MLGRFRLALGGVAVLACLQSTPAFATTVGSYDDGTLRITATGSLDDGIGFNFAYGAGPGLPDILTIYDIPAGVTSEYCVEVNTEQMDCSLGGISRIVIETGDGNDLIDFGELPVGMPVLLSGGAGEDTLSGLQTPGSKINGGPGDDLITGIDGPLFGPSGARERLVGGPGRDVINGLEGDDLLLGGAGADELNGTGGNDRLVGGSGNDRLEPASIAGTDNGRDQFLSGAGTDKLFALDGHADDTLSCGRGNRDVVHIDQVDPKTSGCERNLRF